MQAKRFKPDGWILLLIGPAFDASLLSEGAEHESTLRLFGELHRNVRRCLLQHRQRNEAARAESLRIALEFPLAETGHGHVETAGGVHLQEGRNMSKSKNESDSSVASKRKSPEHDAQANSVCAKKMELLNPGRSSWDKAESSTNTHFKRGVHRFLRAQRDVLG